MVLTQFFTIEASLFKTGKKSAENLAIIYKVNNSIIFQGEANFEYGESRKNCYVLRASRKNG